MNTRRGKRIVGRVPIAIWIVSFATQAIVMPVAIQVAALALAKTLDRLALPYRQLDLVSRILVLAMPDFAGFLIGLLFSRFPAFWREPARWLFVVPALLYPVFLIASIFFNFHNYLIAIFGVRGSDYEGFGALALAFPVVGYCLYSTGIRTGDKYTDPLENVIGDYDVLPVGRKSR